MKDILEKITKNKSVNIDKLNINMTFKVAQTGFLCPEEITYIRTELKKTSFLATKITISDVSFSESKQYVVLCFKQSQINIGHAGVQIVIVATEEKTYRVTALVLLYNLDSHPATASLSCLLSGVFLRFIAVTAHKKCISVVGLVQFDYLDHNSCKGAGQHKTDHGKLDEMI